MLVANICFIFKKGELNCKNYRGIFLLNSWSKILSNILLNRVKPYIHEIIGYYQMEFMTGKSTLAQIDVIKQITEKSYEFDKDIHLLFFIYTFQGCLRFVEQKKNCGAQCANCVYQKSL